PTAIPSSITATKDSALRRFSNRCVFVISGRACYSDREPDGFPPARKCLVESWVGLRVSGIRFEQVELRSSRSVKVFRRQLRPALVDARFFTRQLKQFRHLLGENSFALHSALEVRIVELAAANGANTVENFFFPIRKEKVLNRIRAIRDGKLNDPNFKS